MTNDLHDVLAIYSVERILEEVWWSTFAGGLAALVMTVAFSVMAGLAARWLCGVRLSESLRLAFPGLAALGSFAVILILFWALLQPLPAAAG